MRSIHILLVAVVIVLSGCGKKESEAEKRNLELQAELAARDQFIEEVTGSIHEIHDKLETVWATEKNIMRKSESVEGRKGLSPVELKEKALDRIAKINDILAANRKKVKDLQERLSNSRLQYSGLEKMVSDLQTRLEEREQSVAALETRVMSLEGEVSEKVKVIAAKDVTIASQAKEMSNVFYAVGTEEDLETRGVITEEGGFLWGLLGSTTVLAPGFSLADFYPIDRIEDTRIDVEGLIDELVPKRDPGSYEEEVSEGHTVLKIKKPEEFWKQKHLVIVSYPQ